MLRRSFLKNSLQQTSSRLNIRWSLFRVMVLNHHQCWVSGKPQSALNRTMKWFVFLLTLSRRWLTCQGKMRSTVHVSKWTWASWVVRWRKWNLQSNVWLISYVEWKVSWKVRSLHDMAEKIPVMPILTHWRWTSTHRWTSCQNRLQNPLRTWLTLKPHFLRRFVILKVYCCSSRVFRQKFRKAWCVPVWCHSHACYHVYNVLFAKRLPPWTVQLNWWWTIPKVNWTAVFLKGWLHHLNTCCVTRLTTVLKTVSSVYRLKNQKQGILFWTLAVRVPISWSHSVMMVKGLMSPESRTRRFRQVWWPRIKNLIRKKFYSLSSIQVSVPLHRWPRFLAVVSVWTLYRAISRPWVVTWVSAPFWVREPHLPSAYQQPWR